MSGSWVPCQQLGSPEKTGDLPAEGSYHLCSQRGAEETPYSSFVQIVVCLNQR